MQHCIVISVSRLCSTQFDLYRYSHCLRLMSFVFTLLRSECFKHIAEKYILLQQLYRSLTIRIHDFFTDSAYKFLDNLQIISTFTDNFYFWLREFLLQINIFDTEINWYVSLLQENLFAFNVQPLLKFYYFTAPLPSRLCTSVYPVIQITKNILFNNTLTFKNITLNNKI